MPTILCVVLGVMLALAATVLAVIFILPEKKATSKNAFVRFLHKLISFKSLLLDKILKILYIFSTAFVILTGVLMLFGFENLFGEYSYYLRPTWLGGYGLLLIFVGPIVVRILYESLMMFILLVRNTIDIRNKLYNEEAKSDNELDDLKELFKKKPAPDPVVTPVQNAIPVQSPVVPQHYQNTASPTIPQYQAPINQMQNITPDVTPAPMYVFCTKCGTRYDANDGLCPRCGKIN
ncbi:MAG: zinc ribbon domain-containing protein [Clostridia bacterium]|nr:zinc ribbon domain-containing protein [Clostridia bacterium]